MTFRKKNRQTKRRKSRHRNKARRQNKSRRFNKVGGVKVNKEWPSEWNDYGTLIKEGQITSDDDCIICLLKFSETPDQAIYRLDCCDVLVHNDCLLWLCNMKDRTRPADRREEERLYEEREEIRHDDRLEFELKKRTLEMNADAILKIQHRIMDTCPNCRFNEKTKDAHGEIINQIGFHDCMNVYAFRNKELFTDKFDKQPIVMGIYEANPDPGDEKTETEYLARNIGYTEE
jgi:hypothetical protein